jgi:hypothetical protein
MYDIGAGGGDGGGDLHPTAEPSSISDPVFLEALADLYVRWIKNLSKLSNALQALAPYRQFAIPTHHLEILDLILMEGFLYSSR